MINNEPIFTKQFPIPHKYKDIMREKIKELLDDDVIEEAMSPYNSPVILVVQKFQMNFWTNTHDNYANP